jgi:hypothetical protein
MFENVAAAIGRNVRARWQLGASSPSGLQRLDHDAEIRTGVLHHEVAGLAVYLLQPCRDDFGLLRTSHAVGVAEGYEDCAALDITCPYSHSGHPVEGCEPDWLFVAFSPDQCVQCVVDVAPEGRFDELAWLIGLGYGGPCSSADRLGVGRVVLPARQIAEHDASPLGWRHCRVGRCEHRSKKICSESRTDPRPQRKGRGGLEGTNLSSAERSAGYTNDSAYPRHPRYRIGIVIS